MNGPPRDPAECFAYAALCREAFEMPPLHRYDWLARIDPSNIRLARAGERVVGGLALVPTGMWLRGARVTASAMHIVVVAPDQRKTGIGRGLVAAALRELHDAGTALCVLYPATDAIYRHAGFHDAGVRVRYRATGADLVAPDGATRVERVGRADVASLHEAYRDRASATSGNLDRNPWVWHRVLHELDEATLAVRAIGSDGHVLAYGVAHRAGEDVHLRDLVGVHPNAERAVLAHLAQGARFVEWNGAPVEPVVTASIVGERVWLARICHLERSIATLRVAPDVTATIELDVADELLPENAGRWVVSIAAGTVSIQRGGSGTRAVDIRDLVPIVTGHVASELGGPRPWMPDVF
ncbi:MAG: enhanced intracellular survival protein Eis [Kofleriaceae bacterium]